MTRDDLYALYGAPDDIRRAALGTAGPAFDIALMVTLPDWHAAHELAQSDESPLGSYWHGILHRLEGDYGNAGYWFHRAGGLVGELVAVGAPEPIALTRSVERDGPAAHEASLREEWVRLAEKSTISA